MNVAGKLGVLAISTIATTLAAQASAFAVHYDQDFDPPPVVNGGPRGGAGAMYGDINWDNQHKFHWSASVIDQCPADGLGTSSFYIVAVGPSSGYHYENSTYTRNTVGCGTAVGDTGIAVRTGVIQWARAVGCYSDGDEPCFVTAAFSVVHNNPYR